MKVIWILVLITHSCNHYELLAVLREMAAVFVVEVAIAVFLLLLSLYKYMTSDYSYWKKRNVPFIKPIFPFGNIKDQVTNKTYMGQCYKALYDQMPGERYIGIFELGRPALLLRDLKLIKSVMVNDFQNFADRGHIHENIEHDFLSAQHLFNLKGDKWKRMRSKITPTFTSKRMKSMYELMLKCSQNLDLFLESAEKNKEVVDFKDLLSRFTSDVTSTCFFGLETNAVMEKDSVVRKIGRLMLSTNKWNMIKLTLSVNYPFIFNLFKLKIFDKEVEQFCMQVAKDTYEYRVKNNIYRSDFVDLMIKIKQNKDLYEDEKSDNQGSREIDGNDDGLTFEEMAAQVLLMFGAGFETSSSASTFALYEMSKNPGVLEKAMQEVDSVLKNHDRQITYQALKEMKYLESIIYETTRMYPVLPILTRKCVIPFKIPESDLVIEKGIRVAIPTTGISYDPAVYPDPCKFDPDRFSPERARELPPVSLSFGDGPMTCLGMRFGKMQVKCALATILLKYKLCPVSETPSKITLDPRQLLPTPIEALYFKVSKR